MARPLPLDKDTFDQIIALLLPYMENSGERKAWIETALYGCNVLSQIDWSGAAEPFTMALVRRLVAYGDCSPGQSALAMLLEGWKQRVGLDVQPLIDDLLNSLPKSKTALPPAAPSIQTSPLTANAEQPPPRPEVTAPAPAPSGQSPAHRNPAIWIPVVVAVITGIFGITNLLIPRLLPASPNFPTPVPTTIVATAPTEATPLPEPSPTEGSSLNVTPSETLNFDQRAQTIDASILTETATLWTPTDANIEFQNLLTQRAAGTLAAGQTATATLWTDTPTPTYTNTPTDTPTPSNTPIPLGFIGNPVTSNNQWTRQNIDQYSTKLGGMEVVFVPAGGFELGDDPEGYDRDHVGVIDSGHMDFPNFWISRFEITNADFKQFTCQAARPSNWTENNRPREWIIWKEARDCAAKMCGRLPTEAEWEYAARGPSDLIYPWGDDPNPDNMVIDNRRGQTASVGLTERPGGQSWVGAYDMSGNVWEYTNTIAGTKYYPYATDDGREDSTNETDSHIMRGGSWYYDADIARSASRDGHVSDVRNADLGFRVVWDHNPADDPATGC